jgi:large subunit ribosomal protein L10
MPSQQNIDSVAQITEQLQSAKAVIIADYSGLNVADQTTLRAKIKAAGGTFSVAKNRLFMLAIKNKLGQLPQDLEQALQGPNAIMFALDDAVAATKALVEFAKDHEALEVKIGILAGTEAGQDKVITLDEVKALANLPGRDQLIAQLVGQLNAPIVGFVNVLSGNTRKLVYALKAIQDQKAAN